LGKAPLDLPLSQANKHSQDDVMR